MLWVLSAVVCEGGAALGEVSPHTPSHLTLHSTAGASLQGCLLGDVAVSFPLLCPSSVLLSLQDSTNPALGRSLQGSFSFHPGQENLSCSERNSHKYRSAQRLFWRNWPVSRRTSIPLLGFGCSYNSCQERNWATVSLHMSNLSIFDTLQSLLLLVILMEENQAAIYP